LPCFFPSISTVKTNGRPVEYLSLLVAMREPQFLISAYDIQNTPESEQAQLKRLLTAAQSGGLVTLLDSGNYERYWKRDGEWSPAKLSKVLAWPLFPIAFCFDDQEPPDNLEALVSGVESAVLREQQYSLNGSVLPIIHGHREQLAQAVLAVARRLYPPMVAVPERELGDGLLTRANTVRAIRTALNAMETYVPLHILGTGNPRSILVLAACGADSFDGLEWCQATVDTRTANLHHFQQRELFADECEFCTTDGFSYSLATLAHNLKFMRRWMADVQGATREGKMSDLMKQYLPARFLARLLQILETR